MGNKKKLIKRGLIDLFPKDIELFVDLFAGSATVSINVVNAEKYLINDIDQHLYSLYHMFKNFSPEEIISHIESKIKEYGLSRERTSHKIFEDDRIERYKKAYIKFRSDFNSTDKTNTLDFYTLMFYSFSQQFRFNSKGNFNMPCGNDCFSSKNKEYILNGTRFFNQNNVVICNKNFTFLDIKKLCKNDFIYLDPPYFRTTATYNEHDGWTEKNEYELYELCEKMNKKDIKFGMSNIFENKGIKNYRLINWCKKNGWNVFDFDKISYSPCGRGNSNAKEVFITNY